MSTGIHGEETDYEKLQRFREERTNFVISYNRLLGLLLYIFKYWGLEEIKVPLKDYNECVDKAGMYSKGVEFFLSIPKTSGQVTFRLKELEEDNNAE